MKTKYYLMKNGFIIDSGTLKEIKEIVANWHDEITKKQLLIRKGHRNGSILKLEK